MHFFFPPSHKGLFRLENWETKFDERTTNFTDYMGKEMESLINKKKTMAIGQVYIML